MLNWRAKNTHSSKKLKNECLIYVFIKRKAQENFQGRSNEECLKYSIKRGFKRKAEKLTSFYDLNQNIKKFCEIKYLSKRFFQKKLD